MNVNIPIYHNTYDIRIVSVVYITRLECSIRYAWPIIIVYETHKLKKGHGKSNMIIVYGVQTFYKHKNKTVFLLSLYLC